MTLEMKFDQKYEQGHEDGMEAGRIEGKELLLVTQVKDGILTIEKAAEYMGVTEEEFEKLIKAE